MKARLEKDIFFITNKDLFNIENFLSNTSPFWQNKTKMRFPLATVCVD